MEGARALGFAEGVRKRLDDLGLLPLDTDDMLRTVALWDPIKQRTAVASIIYYAHHVEKNSALGKRIETFLEQAAQEWEAMRPSNDND